MSEFIITLHDITIAVFDAEYNPASDEPQPEGWFWEPLGGASEYHGPFNSRADAVAHANTELAPPGLHLQTC